LRIQTLQHNFQFILGNILKQFTLSNGGKVSFNHFSAPWFLVTYVTDFALRLYYNQVIKTRKGGTIMKRKIVNIDESKCNGCGLCINACHEGALQLVDGKAKLISDSYCDGLGACLPDCPVGAITIEEREAAAFDEAAVQDKITASKAQPVFPEKLECGCPGTLARTIEKKSVADPSPASQEAIRMESQLQQWPCQIQLVPVGAPYFDNAHLLVAADCTAYAYANIHRDFMRNKITIIGCPKLDEADYVEKLTAILNAHELKSITVLRMEVPCCGGIAHAVKQALINSGKMIPWNVVTISTDGKVLKD
jgi:ferredoxin